MLVDDEVAALSLLEKLCLLIDDKAFIKSFNNSLEALEYAKSNNFDIALLDIDMPNMDGLQLSLKLRDLNHKLNIIMVTAYDQYALDALKFDCSGYLLKPITLKDLKHQFDVLRYPVDVNKDKEILKIVCFGNFEVYFKGKPVEFEYNKAKELLAYLIDRNGAMCSNGQILVSLWDDDEDHTSYLKLLKRDLINSLKKCGKDDIIITSRGYIAVNMNLISCDYADYLDGKNSKYNGEYMEQYLWADYTRSNLDYKHNKGKR